MIREREKKREKEQIKIVRLLCFKRDVKYLSFCIDQIQLK